MSVSTTIVTVPATTANLGPGFDCIGAALTLYNEFKFTRRDHGGVTISVTGKEAARVETSESNLGYQAFLKLYEYLGQQPPPVEIEIKLGVPLARGLGSSASAIVGGLLGANMLAGEPLSQLQVMELAIAMEGHPDNVVPALIGGCRLAATGLSTGWEIAEIPWNPKVIPVVAIPDFELSTQEARSVLPTTISRADTIFNVSHLGLLLRGLETGKGDWLQAALQDRLHQPYRQALIPGYADVSAAAKLAGAYGMVISGAGPTLLALADLGHAADVAVAMQIAWKKVGIGAEVLKLALDLQGAKIS